MPDMQTKHQKEKVLITPTLWRGTFEAKPRPIILYRAAYSKKQAWLRMCKVISQMQNVPVKNVMEHYDFDDKMVDNFEIKVEENIWQN